MGCVPIKDQTNVTPDATGYNKKSIVGRTMTKFFDAYYLEENLSTGFFSDTWTVRHRTTRDLRAVEIIRKSIIKQYSKAFETLMDKLQNLISLDSPNVIKMYEVIEDKHRFYVVTEPLLGDDLLAHITNLPPEQVTEKLLAGYVKQVLSGLCHCHSKDLFHKDIRPKNLIFSSKEGKVLKLTDFGLSKFEDIEDLNIAIYTPPEILEDKPYTAKSDIWSCGILCYFLLSGEIPCELAQSPEKFLETIKSKEYTLETLSGPAWESISLEAKKFLLRTLVKDPDKRATAMELLTDPWLEAAKDIPCNPELAKKYLDNFRSSSVYFLWQLFTQGTQRFQRAVMSYIVHHAGTISDQEDLISFFKRLDKDGDQRLNREEFKQGTVRLNQAQQDSWRTELQYQKRKQTKYSSDWTQVKTEAQATQNTWQGLQTFVY
eukprot:TRINITY_DN120924_c1_g1_i1.p1 TRINITY_DN120924_c1_g1~~TRINITY_DN120924_c1_g1_i1.p1  ORF type:complete len:463 (-),score=20.11 TRINITY_DN120924_c1_g1_i1:343-1635(-)